jgi:lipopolysaccharide heptosyltransferase II
MRILVVRTDRIGDVLLSTPVAGALKGASRENHVTMMVSPYTKPILENNPNVDEILVCSSTDKNGELARKLSRAKYDVAVLLHPTLRLAWVLARSRIPRRIGTASRAYSFLFNERIHLRRSLSNLHEAECNLAMVEPLCGKADSIRPELFVTEEEEALAEEKLASLGLNPGDFVAIHPGSGGSARDWPLRRFASLADAVESGLGKRVLVTGGPGEEELISRMMTLLKSRPARVSGESGIRLLAAILARASALVTNSTGPMHLATAVNTPVVSIFCPIKGCSPSRWGPLGTRSEVLMPRVPVCERCIGDRCKHYDCMEKVGVEQVLEAVGRVLEH